MPNAAPKIDLAVNGGDWPPKAALRRLAGRVVRAAAGALALPGDAELSLLFTDDAQMRRLNAEWRGVDKPTNVLSFPGRASPQPGGGASPLLGDIALAAETVRREADEAGLALEDHLAHLLVHGLLHLLGHDHLQADEAGRMEALEVDILRRLDIADPYAGRALA